VSVATDCNSLLISPLVSPTVKHLFKGFDVTIFAYGVTGTGKTHTMRGGKSLQERGVIPRLLSSIYRRARKVEKDSSGESSVHVSMSYYEIYNDKVFDLFEAPDKRTPAGLPIRDNEKGKAIVVGLTERPCTSLKEFEVLYDQANVNRSTSATKLNAHSSRSHAVLCVKVSQTTGEQVRVSTVCAIDLAGSEDNRRTDNNKERLVESSAINKSLFVLAQCVEAISKSQTRIPYRESKMTRILALGQNKSHTIMVLNLAPVKSYHLDTMSSLNFANRTKKIETNEIENQPFFRDAPGKGKVEGGSATAARASAMNRQPLRPKILSHNSHLKDVGNGVAKPAKSFAVFADKPSKPAPLANIASSRMVKPSIRSPKRPNTDPISSLARPSKIARTQPPKAESGMSQSAIEALIERKVTEALAERVDSTTLANPEPISEEVQKRLDALEKRVGGQETERAEGLQFLLMAKQHQVRGEDASALRMYQLAQPHFPGNEKLMRKVVALQDRLREKSAEGHASPRATATIVPVVEQPQAPKHFSRPATRPIRKFAAVADDEDLSYHEAQTHAADEEDEEEEFTYRPRTKVRRPRTKITADSEDELADMAVFTTTASSQSIEQTPRTKHLLAVINSRDVSQIKLLKGVGAKRAEAIANCLCDLDMGEEAEGGRVASLGELGRIKGVGGRMVENMRLGLLV
jgi:DNA uptake protein ComE-like DNA-binding protein